MAFNVPQYINDEIDFSKELVWNELQSDQYVVIQRSPFQLYMGRVVQRERLRSFHRLTFGIQFKMVSNGPLALVNGPLADIRAPVLPPEVVTWKRTPDTKVYAWDYSMVSSRGRRGAYSPISTGFSSASKPKKPRKSRRHVRTGTVPVPGSTRAAYAQQVADRFAFLFAQLGGVEQRKAYVSQRNLLVTARNTLHDSFSLLGMDSEISEEEFKQRSRRLLLDWHPDKAAVFVLERKGSQATFERQSKLVTDALAEVRSYIEGRDKLKI